MDIRSPEAGLSLIELMITIAISSIIILPVGGGMVQAINAWQYGSERSQLMYEANFALDRISDTVRSSRHLLYPLGRIADNTVVNSLAVCLDPTLDLNNDGFADADNDHDGLVDEDLGPDANFDGHPGILGVDDNNDGLIDNAAIPDDDEDGLSNEDPAGDINNDGNLDDDGDGFIDEDSTSGVDEDGDGTTDEDWYDSVVYFLNGTNLIERLPSTTDINGDFIVTGQDYIERIIAENVEKFEIKRFSSGRKIIIDISLALTSQYGTPLEMNTRIRAKE